MWWRGPIVMTFLAVSARAAAQPHAEAPDAASDATEPHPPAPAVGTADATHDASPAPAASPPGASAPGVGDTVEPREPPPAAPPGATDPPVGSPDPGAAPPRSTAAPVYSGQTPARPGARTHDGFYFRFGTGLTFLWDSIDSRNFEAAHLRGLGVGGELLIGGTPAPGLVIGGGTAGATVYSPALEIDGRDMTRAPDVLGLSAIGVFADYYPQPSRGLHFQAFAGYAVLQADGSAPRKSPDGLALSVGAGHEWWLADEWSIGAMLRLLYATLVYDSAWLNERHSVLAPALMVTVTYH
jgi:hypothetical protein